MTKAEAFDTQMQMADAVDSQEEQTVAQMAQNLAEVCFGNHPLGTEENVKALAAKIEKAARLYL